MDEPRDKRPSHTQSTTRGCSGPQALPGPATMGKSQPGPAESPATGGSSEAGAKGLEPATSGVTGRRSNQLSYAPGKGKDQYAKPVAVARRERNSGRGRG